ncbi:MAG TPA: hypothetical protein VLL48_12715, partial [Longimicrobiales bacterium]|nr:hypothetical protein [Longimicrobiales bacterium]
PTAVEATAVRTVLELPEGDRVAGAEVGFTGNANRPSRTALTFSPDGRALVYVGERGGVRGLFLRQRSSDASTPISGTEGAESPFLSPDGRELGFFSEGKLWRMPLAGGPATELAELEMPLGADWSEDGGIVYGSILGGVVVLSVNGTQPPDTVLEPPARLPRFLPDGEHVVYTRRDPGAINSVHVVSLATGETRLLMEDAADGRYLPTGHLLFARDGVMMAAPFDLRRLRATGAAVVVEPDVMQGLNGGNTGVTTGAMQAAVSSTGHLAYLVGGITPDPKHRLVWLDRQGRRTPIETLGEARFGNVRIAPEGARLAVTLAGTDPQTRIFDIVRGTWQTLPGSGIPRWPLWFPDGRRILTRGVVGDSVGLVATLADGSQAPERLADVEGNGGPAFWSPEGEELFLVRMGGEGLTGLALADGSVRNVAGFPPDATHAVLSPDGRWLAYRAVEPGSGSSEVYVRPWPALDGQWKVSVAGGFEPVWTREGRELVYLEPVGLQDPALGVGEVRFMSVELGEDPDFSSAVPQPLFTTTMNRANPLRAFDVTADGSRFVVIEPGEEEPSPPGDIHLVANWFSELRRLVREGGG